MMKIWRLSITAATFAVGEPAGGAITGLMAAGALWIASLFAVHRDWQAKRVL